MTEITPYNDTHVLSAAYRWHGICKFDQMLLKKLHITTNDCTTKKSTKTEIT